VISGRRPVRDTEGRAYQQVEIPTGEFRRVVELGADVEADQAKATFEDGILRVELPIRPAAAGKRTVPIERTD
jgi:HSP20 family protein